MLYILSMPLVYFRAPTVLEGTTGTLSCDGLAIAADKSGVSQIY